MKNAIIIGASSGIGRGLAQLLVNEGYKVGITGRRRALLDELKDSSPQSYVVSSFDVNDYDNLQNNLNSLVGQIGDIDLIILCSGIGKRNSELFLDWEIDTLYTNVVAFTYIINWAYDYFKKMGRGNLAAISSISGIRGLAISPAYSSSKSFQIKYLEALRQKVENEKVPLHITDIRAGFVDTALGNGEGSFWICSVKKAAEQIYSAIKKERKVAYVSRRWRAVSFVLKIAPRSIYEKVKLYKRDKKEGDGI